ncbi:MAG: bifunctional 4-hydroxy-2-oxoglutarate aldolase/2-dehydro-3-deoxy-phosphogluconate aldolase [Endomicrobium sp.]|uniref:bifunctional 4-hydroxy-2-oxoglutarate aldolase/2-dehydro-3-deoxy-phosphogluconate aldolase n=1 Tax=Candidatus Endomicrobiellum pyrsonymphae TaxID=1408203 RepID=UPI003583D32A|nr:bifunctional 4-hydroxy-2-oxoglutarate aldolase/2-dehydro-3-deoxy-phosphogluconate aldolase [Endomicrobium sp.]
MNNLLIEISKIGIVPVVVLDNPQQALPLAKALYAGGIRCAEITFRTMAAEESIKIICKEMPEMLIGAGTVLTVEQVDKAVAAGAKFIVSPGLNPKIVRHCLNKGITIIPGCATPSDVEIAMESKLEIVKFFPAEAAGGINMIKAMAMPYANIKFMPTGGIDIKNLNTYLSFNKVIACGGSWMVNKELIKNGDYETITKLSKEALFAMLGFEVQHIGINMLDAISASETSKRFETVFGFTKKEFSGSFFAGSGIEVMKKQFFGKNGHIAIRTNNVTRAVYHLQQEGVIFDDKTASYDEDGNLRIIYLREEIGNFAVHLVGKK